MRRLIILLLVSTALFFPGLAGAEQERIISYDTLISIQEDASVIITETIEVVSTGNQIKRGIFRDFPTSYKDEYGNRVRVDFHLLSVLRDGNPDNYKAEALSNGTRIYIGKENVFLPPGTYTYEITYKVKRVLGFFPEHDELYWNITGNSWDFPIEHVSALIILPPGATSKISTDGFTGLQGSQGKDFEAVIHEGAVQFNSTRSFSPQEGLTVVVGWPKGHVAQPTTQAKLFWFFQDNQGALVALAGLVLILVYFLYAWTRVGKDPRKGIIIPRYTPPEGVSPAAMRYVRRMGYDNKVFTAAIINLAVQGKLNILEEGKSFVLVKTPAELSPGSPEEDAVYSCLFARREQISLVNTNHTIISKAIQTCRDLLKKDCHGKYFHTNTMWLFPGVIASLAFIGLGFLLSKGNAGGLFAAVWLSIWSIGTFMLIKQVRANWNQGKKGASLAMGCFSIPFVAGWFLGLWVLLSSGGAVFSILLAAIISLNIVFARLLKAPTYAGRRLLDEIEGFKLFLEVAEKDYLQWAAAPERTPELFEKYLPHALALDVDQQWAEKFSAILAASSAQGDYHPVWYQGRSYTAFSATSFAGNLSGSLGNAITSSGVAPGSSSGFSGGSSGGGGGGGGGGGW